MVQHIEPCVIAGIYDDIFEQRNDNNIATNRGIIHIDNGYTAHCDAWVSNILYYGRLYIFVI